MCLAKIAAEGGREQVPGWQLEEDFSGLGGLMTEDLLLSLDKLDEDEDEDVLQQWSRQQPREVAPLRRHGAGGMSIVSCARSKVRLLLDDGWVQKLCKRVQVDLLSFSPLAVSLAAFFLLLTHFSPFCSPAGPGGVGRVLPAGVRVPLGRNQPSEYRHLLHGCCSPFLVCVCVCFCRRVSL